MKHVPQPLKKALWPVWIASKRIVNPLMDLVDLLTSNKNPLVPPRNMMFVGDGDYEKTGKEFLGYFKELGRLQPGDRVLDVGCGIGRMSVPLTDYLAGGGSYYGFDIVETGIDWCNENIASRYPNFHYHHADIYNKMYNPSGKERSSEYTFPYESNFFDFVFLTSVFTHMFAPDVERYLAEIHRVMKPGSRCLISCFLINEESEPLIMSGQSTLDLVYPVDENTFTRDRDTPESAIGYREEYFLSLCNSSGLRVDGEVQYGRWCGRRQYRSYQDILIGQKR